MKKVTLQDFAESFGTTESDLSVCKSLFDKFDFSYREISGKEKDDLILQVLRKIKNDTQIIGAPEREQIWEDGWSENLKQFRDNKDDLSCVIPKFFRPNEPIRFKLQYIQPSNPTFLKDYYLLFQQWLFTKYLQGFDTIYEFGCGSGINLLAMANLFPQTKLIGYDFVPSSVELINGIAQHHGSTYVDSPSVMVVTSSITLPESSR